MEKMKNLLVRTFSGLVLTGVFVGAILWSQWSFGALLLLILIGGMLEFYRLSEDTGISPQRWLGLVIGVTLFLLNFVVARVFEQPVTERIGAIVFVLLVYVALALPTLFVCELFRKSPTPLANLGATSLGVLYIAEKGDSVHSVEDLRGKTIYSSGNGATPEYALRFVLESAGLEIGRDVFIEWRSEHAECVAALEANDEAVAMLPQPFLTSALLSDSSIRVALDLNDLWMEAMGTELITGVVIARTSFIEENEDDVRAFLSSYGDSVDFVNGNISEGAALVGEYGIIGEKVANLAIPGCNITLITGEEMKAALSNYLGVLYSMNPKSVGGALPNEDYYFI